MATILVCYDISANPERDHVSRLLEKHGHRIQESVFEVHRLDDSRRRLLTTTLREIVSDPASVRFYRIGAATRGDCTDLAGRPLAVRHRVCIF